MGLDITENFSKTLLLAHLSKFVFYRNKLLSLIPIMIKNINIQLKLYSTCVYKVRNFSKILLFIVEHHYGNDIIFLANLFSDSVKT